MIEKLLDTVTGRNAARDVEFLLHLARLSADPDPERRGPACELVRIAYEGDAYDGPGIHIHTHEQMKASGPDCHRTATQTQGAFSHALGIAVRFRRQQSARSESRLFALRRDRYEHDGPAQEDEPGL